MQDMINIAICEDEEIQIQLLKKYVKNWANEKNIKVKIESFNSAESFDFNWSMDKSWDILLLDIQMPGQNGIDLAKRIRKEDDIINIIFITAITDYIQEGYDVEAINYLIKPIDEIKLHKCLDRAAKKIHKEKKTIIIDFEGDIHRIIQDDIMYIEAFSHTININTIDGKYITRKNIGVIEKELDKDNFIRCHRSYIVGLKYVKKIGKKELELDNNVIIPISRRRYTNTNMAFINYYRGEKND